MKILLVICILIFPLFASWADDSGSSSALKQEALTYRQEGYRLQSRGDLKGALMYYQKAVQMDPHYAEVHNDLGVIYEAMGEETQAISAYKEALKLDPNYLAAYTNLALIYEKKGDIKNATTYWKKRYSLGEKGEYWWEMSRQHLLKLGTYPQVRKEIMEEKAAILSREFIYKRGQERLKLIQEAKLHLDMGKRALKADQAEKALGEFRTVLTLNPADERLTEEARILYGQSEKIYLKQQATVNTKSALDYIKNNDYLSAGERLKDALDAVFRVSQ